MNRKQFRPKWKYPSNVKWRCLDCGAQFRENPPGWWERHSLTGPRHEGFVMVTTDVTSPRFGNCR